jgi:hypothetical protein
MLPAFVLPWQRLGRCERLHHLEEPMPEEQVIRDPDDQSGSNSALEEATESVQRAMSTMKLMAQNIALKQETAGMSLERSTAALIEAAGHLSSAVTALSQTLSDISIEKPAGEAALKRAMNVFVRAAAELNKVSGTLRAAVSNEKAAAQRNRTSKDVSSQRKSDDSGLVQAADRLRQTAAALSRSTDALGESGVDRDSKAPLDHPARPIPSDDIALKDE